MPSSRTLDIAPLHEIEHEQHDHRGERDGREPELLAADDPAGRASRA
jgi:hypothetical protein